MKTKPNGTLWRDSFLSCWGLGGFNCSDLQVQIQTGSVGPEDFPGEDRSTTFGPTFGSLNEHVSNDNKVGLPRDKVCLVHHDNQKDQQCGGDGDRL